MNCSMTVTYLMLKNNEEMNYKKLSSIFPLFTMKKFYNLINYLKILIDEELYIENKISIKRI